MSQPPDRVTGFCEECQETLDFLFSSRDLSTSFGEVRVRFLECTACGDLTPYWATGINNTVLDGTEEILSVLEETKEML